MQTQERDFFTDTSVALDPYPFFADLYSRGPVYLSKVRDVVFVTGYDEVNEVLRNADDFSSAICVVGAGVPLPFKPEGDEIAAQLEKHRGEIPGTDLLVTYDGAHHAALRSLLSRLFTPSRLRANEVFMQTYADELVRKVVAQGGCELIKDVAAYYVTLVVADLLGVPSEDREKFRQIIDAGPPAGNMEADDQPHSNGILEQLGAVFFGYVLDRRANPRADILTELATAKLPDGSTPDVAEIVRLSTFLFGAGQDTSAKLLGNCMRFLTENPDVQQQLRDDRSLIPAFIEEVLRLDGSSKVTFRVARRKTRIGDVEIPAGQRIVLGLTASNRDPRRWEDPTAFKIGRERGREHMSFARGAHTCIGAPLARAEVRVILDRLLEHTSAITLSEAHHGSAGNRQFRYEPSFIIRGLEDLHLVLKAR